MRNVFEKIETKNNQLLKIWYITRLDFSTVKTEKYRHSSNAIYWIHSLEKEKAHNFQLS